jgi:hypothetical protein
MTTVPRRLAFRIWVACIEAQIRELEGRTPGRSAGRRGPEAAAGTAAKAPGRRDQVAGLSEHARQLHRWIADPEACRGGEVPLETVSLVSALIFGHLNALAPLRQRYLCADIHRTEIVEIIRAVLATPGAPP